MPRICSNDARIESYDFEYRAKKRDTYNVFGRVWGLVFDRFQLSEPPGIDWNRFGLLKTSLAMISNSNLLSLFPHLVLLVLAASNPIFRAFAFLL